MSKNKALQDAAFSPSDWLIGQVRRVGRAINRRIAKRFKRVVARQRIHKCVVMGHIILLDVESEIEEFRANTYATKEPETLEWIERFFAPGDVMYDVGANIGLYSIFAARSLGGQCKVYAFEPEALNCAKLNMNIHLNHLSGVVVPCCLALTDSLCFDTFALNPDNFEKMVAGHELVAGSSLHSFGGAGDRQGRVFRPIHMQGTVGVSVDYLWRVWGLDFPNHIKIDVDGLEDKIIAGATQTLDDRRLRTVLVEISPVMDDIAPISLRLTQAGFVPVTDFAAHSSEQLVGTPFEGYVNSVFIREP